jgi:hypothetical protein
MSRLQIGIGNEPPNNKNLLNSNPVEDYTSNGSFLPYFHAQQFACLFVCLFFWGDQVLKGGTRNT